MKNEIQLQYAKDYILGGKAHVVIYNEDTKEQRRFVIYAEWKKDPNHPYKPVEKKRENIEYWKVFDMDSKPKKFLGKLIIDAEISVGSTVTWERVNFYPEKEKGTNEYKPLAKNFNYIWRGIINQDLTTNYHILHLGSCSICGRPLTEAESLYRGIGPKCWSTMYHPSKTK
jgi:uncharacterized protein DUF6011